MAKRNPKSQPTWKDVKAKLAEFDRAGLLGLVQDLYAARKENQLFLHTRLGLGEDILGQYKDTVQRWISPDVFRKQDVSISKANQAVSDYKKAVHDPAGLADLMIFYCELGVGFCAEYGNDDLAFFRALVNMFGQAFLTALSLPRVTRDPLISRLEQVRRDSEVLGYGVDLQMAEWLANYDPFADLPADV